MYLRNKQYVDIILNRKINININRKINYMLFWALKFVPLANNATFAQNLFFVLRVNDCFHKD